MKICIMTSVHKHDDVRIYHKEAKALREKGHDVVILCTDYEGTDENGIEFIRVKLPKARFLRLITASPIFFFAALKVHARVYHFHDPELISAGRRISKRTHVIYDIHEDVPRQILTKPYLKPKTAAFFSKWFEKREDKAISSLDIIITAAPVIEKRVKKLTQSTLMVCNYPKLEEFTVTDIPFSSRENKVCYIGGITKIRGAHEMLSAIEQAGDTRLALAGAYESEPLRRELEALSGFEKTDYLGFLSREGVQELLNTSRAGLVTLHPTPTYVESLPVKMFEYMLAQIPVIASDFPYWQEIVDDACCGVCVDPMKPSDIAGAIGYIIKNEDVAEEMGQNGKQAVLKKYNWDIEKRKLVAVYDYLSTLSPKQRAKGKGKNT